MQNKTSLADPFYKTIFGIEAYVIILTEASPSLSFVCYRGIFIDFFNGKTDGDHKDAGASRF